MLRLVSYCCSPNHWKENNSVSTNWWPTGKWKTTSSETQGVDKFPNTKSSRRSRRTAQRENGSMLRFLWLNRVISVSSSMVGVQTYWSSSNRQDGKGVIRHRFLAAFCCVRPCHRLPFQRSVHHSRNARQQRRLHTSVGFCGSLVRSHWHSVPVGQPFKNDG